MILNVIIILVMLAVHLYLAFFFSDHAEAKGYDARPYFWLCLLLGVIGYCVVAVLPNLILMDEIDRLWAFIESKESESDTPDTWICKQCETENSNNYTQCKKCGKFRSS